MGLNNRYLVFTSSCGLLPLKKKKLLNFFFPQFPLVYSYLVRLGIRVTDLYHTKHVVVFCTSFAAFISRGRRRTVVSPVEPPKPHLIPEEQIPCEVASGSHNTLRRKLHNARAQRHRQLHSHNHESEHGT